MNDRKYIKLNTSIQTGSNAGQIPEESDGTIPATIQLRLPNNIFSSQDGAQKVDDVSMLTTKFRISMRETPIIQIPMDEELSSQKQQKISQCKLDVYPFSILQDNVLKPNTPGENVAFPQYKEHFYQYLFRFFDNPTKGTMDSSYYYGVYNAVDVRWVPNNNEDDKLKFEIVKRLNIFDDQILNLTVPTHHESVNISEGYVYLKKLATIQQMLADGIQTAMTYASSKVVKTYVIDFIRSDYADSVSPAVNKDISYVYHYAGDKSNIYYFWKIDDSSDNNVHSYLDFAIKPLVKITENSFTISYDSGSFQNNIPILWNPAYVNTFDTPIQMTLSDLMTTESYQPPPKRIYKYGVKTSGDDIDNLSYEFSLIQPEICTVYNLIGNRVARDTFPFLEWSPIKVINPPQTSIKPIYSYKEFWQATRNTDERKYNYFCNRQTAAGNPDLAKVSVSQYSVGDTTAAAYGLYYAGYDNATPPVLNPIPAMVRNNVVPQKNRYGVFLCVHFYYEPQDGVRPLLSSYKTNGLICVPANTSSFTNQIITLNSFDYIANMNIKTETSNLQTEYLEYDITFDPTKYTQGTTVVPYSPSGKDYSENNHVESVGNVKAFFPYYSDYCKPLENTYAYTNADEHYVMGRSIDGFNNWVYQGGPPSFPGFYSSCLRNCLPPWEEDIMITGDTIQRIDGHDCYECVCGWYLYKIDTTIPSWDNDSILFANSQDPTPISDSLDNRSFNRTIILYSNGTLTTSFGNNGEVSLAYPNMLENKEETFYFLDGSSTSVNIGSPEVIVPEASGIVYHVDDTTETTSKSYSVDTDHTYAPVNPFNYTITTNPDTGEISVSSSPAVALYKYQNTFAINGADIQTEIPTIDYVPFPTGTYKYFKYCFKMPFTSGQPLDFTNESLHYDQYLISEYYPDGMEREVEVDLFVHENEGDPTEISSSTTTTLNQYDSTDPDMAQYVPTPGIVSDTTVLSNYQYPDNQLSTRDDWFTRASFLDLLYFDRDAEGGVRMSDYSFTWFDHPIATYPGNYDPMCQSYSRIGKPFDYDPEYKYAGVVSNHGTYVECVQYIFVNISATTSEHEAVNIGEPSMRFRLEDHARLIAPYTYNSTQEIVTRSQLLLILLIIVLHVDYHLHGTILQLLLCRLYKVLYLY